MSFGGGPFGGRTYGGGDVADIPTNALPILAVEVSFTTGALETPAWVDITGDVRSWDVSRGRTRELERFQPGRATVVLSNLSRQYDSQYADGPWFGNLKPSRRIRIRQTFNGVTYPVFDGFVDKWQLDYPNTGKDATATVIATDGFKILARTELPRSVYTYEVEQDEPVLWWLLNDPQFLFAAVDASGNDRTGTPKGNVKFGQETLIVNDPGSSIGLDEASDTNVEASLTLDGAAAFAFEFWFKFEEAPSATSFLAHLTSGGSAQCNFQINNSTLKGGFVFQNDAAGAFSAQPDFVFVVGQRYHIVCTHESDRVLRVYINGAEESYDVQDTTTGATSLTLAAVGSSDASTACRALVDEFAVYTTVPSDARILAHYTAGTAPWSGDLPGARAERILDLTEWPDNLRELDDGLTTFQSASVTGQTALEHMHKIAETEFGLMFVARDGSVRLIDRNHMFGRVPAPVVFGDSTGEIGYRGIEFDDGDELIRNSATISRLNGVAKTAVDADSVAEFGRFQYTLEGLLHE